MTALSEIACMHTAGAVAICTKKTHKPMLQGCCIWGPDGWDSGKIDHVESQVFLYGMWKSPSHRINACSASLLNG